MTKTKTSVKSKTINKLILVGNGFDLSLGLKTKYEDFLFWYFKSFIYKSLLNRVSKKNSNGEFIYLHNEDDLFLFYNRENYNHGELQVQSFLKDKKSLEEIKDYILNNPKGFMYSFKSTLLERIFLDSNSGWVDIENTYFNLLKEDLNESGKNISRLNSDLNMIKELLSSYLKQLDYSKTTEDRVAFKHIEQFAKDISWDELPSNYAYDFDELKTGETLFLNFNYTQSLSNITVKKLIDYFNEKNKCCGFSINHIHGDLNKEIDSIIFGYGDEMDKDYKKIEELNDKRYFNHIKSFKYLENRSYRELLKYLDYEDYQVIIYGHSCGLSDRVMLNEIFEHKNCKSIKVCFYNKAEFINKTMDISLHFNSNQIMRQKVLPFNEMDKIPQL